jgi:aminopeptidase N
VLGTNIDASFARQPEILDFLASYFGKYPFSAAGGIVDDYNRLGFALENQTRPIYAKEFFGDPIGADAVVVHEYAHQWFGDNLPLAGWTDIWLDEGFATYAEWLWSE